MKSIMCGDGDVAAQVNQEGHAAAQDADEQQIAIGIIRADLCSQFLDA